MRIVFFNVGWMGAYQGFARGDTISGDGKWVEKHGVGHEAFNYKPYRGRPIKGHGGVPGAAGRHLGGNGPWRAA